MFVILNATDCWAPLYISICRVVWDLLFLTYNLTDSNKKNYVFNLIYAVKRKGTTFDKIL